MVGFFEGLQPMAETNTTSDSTTYLLLPPQEETAETGSLWLGREDPLAGMGGPFGWDGRTLWLGWEDPLAGTGEPFEWDGRTLWL